jgi:hypothetical protein
MPLKTGLFAFFSVVTFALLRPCGKSGPSAVVKPHHRLKAYAAMRHLSDPVWIAVQHRILAKPPGRHGRLMPAVHFLQICHAAKT